MIWINKPSVIEFEFELGLVLNWDSDCVYDLNLIERLLPVSGGKR